MIQQVPVPLHATEEFAEVRRLYGEGLYLQAFAKGQAIAPLREWGGPEGRVMAGRLAGVVGGGRLGRALHLLALRENPNEPQVCYFGVRAVWSRCGPWRARRLWNRIGPLPDAPHELRADWLAQYASISATLRDFEVADEFLEQALALTPDRAWVHVERSAVLQIEDRFDEALASAEHALALRPWYRPAVQALAEQLCGRNRDAEAIELLSAAAERLECGDIVAHLASLQSELGRYADARQNLSRLAELYPLQDKHVVQWIAARECDLACECDDLPAAIAAGRRAGRGYFEQIVTNLEAAQPADRRVVLPVAFVQQHHVTCAPATMTALCKFWGRNVDHLDIAERICYDGTPHHRQRQWAESNGFVVREFAVDWDAIRSLIDRSVPFTMVTIQPPTSHLIAVIGYDARRRTLVLRDPSLRHRTEMLADEGLKSLRSTGPMGMVMLPRDEARRLDGVVLPEAGLYDDLYELQMALERHDREHAAAVHQRMREVQPEHRLTFYGRRALATYDCDPVGASHAYAQMLKQFPDDTMLRLAQVDSMRFDASRQERIALLESLVSQPGTDSLFRLQLAEELSQDARSHGEARRLVRRLLVQRPYEARCYYTLAKLEWEAMRFDEATQLYRTAACLNDKDDRYARDWFLAARHVKQGDQALAFLRHRFERFGNQSSRPAISLSHAYGNLNRGHDALAVLDEAVRRRPDDGELLLFAADSYGRRGDFPRARGLLVEAEGHCRRIGWLRSAAALAASEGELQRARDYWAEVLADEPQAPDARGEYCSLLAATAGETAACDHLRQTIARFPNNLALIHLAVERLRTDHPDEAEAMIRRMLEANPVDAWAHRELAVLAVNSGRMSEALVEAETAIALSPSDSVGYGVRGWVRERSDEVVQAMADYRLAIEHSADDEQAIARLVYCAATHAERVAALDFVHEQLKRQTTFGTGILAYREQARGVLTPEDVLAHLREALAARPDLWHASSAVIRQLTAMNQLAEAMQLAVETTERFPLLPGAWCDLAGARRAGGETEAEIEALEKALELNPNWDMPIRALAETLSHSGQFERERTLLENAVARLPLDGVLHGFLADARRKTGQREEALLSLEQAIRNMPDYDWAWNTLEEQSQQLGSGERTERAARDLVARRPGDARSWLRLARVLRTPAALEERMAALDRTIALNPRTTAAHLQRAETLRAAGRFAEARQACAPANFGDRLPADLRLEAARVSAAEGRPEIALAEVRAIVEENPDYYNGWRQICEWDLEIPANKAELLEAAQRLVASHPDDAVAWRYLADAHLAHENREEAKKAFRRAIELWPPWTYARNRLFDLHFQEREYEEASKVLQWALDHDRNAFSLARQMQLLGSSQKREAAADVFRELCSCELPTTWPLATAVAEMEKLRCREFAVRALRAAMDAPNAVAQIFTEWARLEVKRKRSRQAAKVLKAFSDRPAGWAAAAGVLLEGMAQAKQKWSVRWFIRRNADRLRRDPAAWGSAGYALVTIGRQRSAVKWLTDWKSRDDVRPWMLLNLAVSLFGLRRYLEAAAIHRNALTLPSDTTSATHRVYLASLEVAAGQFETAKTLVKEASGLSEIPDCIRSIVEEVIDLRNDATVARRWFPSLEARRRLSRRVDRYRRLMTSSRFLRRAYSRDVRRLARDRGWWLLWLLSF